LYFIHEKYDYIKLSQILLPQNYFWIFLLFLNCFPYFTLVLKTVLVWAVTCKLYRTNIKTRKIIFYLKNKKDKKEKLLKKQTYPKNPYIFKPKKSFEYLLTWRYFTVCGLCFVLMDFPHVCWFFYKAGSCFVLRSWKVLGSTGHKMSLSSHIQAKYKHNFWPFIERRDRLGPAEKDPYSEVTQIFC